MKLGHVVLDLNGEELSAEEREILEHPAVAGVVLFSRNFQSKKQLINLIIEIQKIRSPLIICVDQEGGRVQRFGEPFTFLKAMREWGKDYQNNKKETLLKFQKSIRLLCKELHEVGIYFNLIPVLDIDHQLSEIIGERSFHSDPAIIIELAKVLILCVHECNMPVTAKHFPGHGGVMADSHHALPVDQRDLETLWQCDLKPFVHLAPLLDSMMTAHVVYPAVDTLPATFSAVWLQDILRKRCNFNGVIMSDDLTMGGAAAYIPHYEDRANQALQAGCDLVFACNHRQGAIKIIESLENYKNSVSAGRIFKYVQRRSFN